MKLGFSTSPFRSDHKIAKLTVRFTSAFPSAWNNLGPTGRIFMKFCVGFYETLSRKFKFEI